MLNSKSISTSPKTGLVEVFETFRTYEGGVWRIQDHWDRWQNSARVLGFDLPLDLVDLEKTLTQKLLGVTGEQRIRAVSSSENWRLEQMEFVPSAYEAGVRVIDRVFERDQAAAKHTAHDYSYFQSLAAITGSFDVLWFDASGQLGEGNITNVFAVIDNEICTPPTEKILSGLMRKWVIAEGAVTERPITRNELSSAQEIFLTNMVRGIVPVQNWNQWQPQTLAASRMLQRRLNLITKDPSNITCQTKRLP